MNHWLGFPIPAATRWARTLLADHNFDIVDEVVAVADELGVDPAAVAIAWVAERPGVSSVILGPRTVDQLRDNLDGFSVALPAEPRTRLDAVSAPVNGPVPGMLVSA